MADDQNINPQGGANLGAGINPPIPPAQGNTSGYVFGDSTNKLFAENPPAIPIPEHPNTKFDERKFLQLLTGSISLLKAEKWKIVESIPKLSQFQIDELMKILEEEKSKFAELSKEHGQQLQQLEENAGREMLEIAAALAEDTDEDKSEDQADQIRKNLGLN
jgi:hypothetical protein